MAYKNLIMIRGLPGAGKTKLAHALVEMLSTPKKKAVATAADDFMVTFSGDYDFQVPRLPPCHLACQTVVKISMHLGAQWIIVHNTFVCRWEMQPYIDLAESMGYQYTVRYPEPGYDGGLTDAALAARNLHGVPATKIAEMRTNFEHRWELGDPRKPWERTA